MRPDEPVILPPLTVDVKLPPPTKWEQEYQAFLRLLPELQKTLYGQFVAIHQGQVVDSGPDDIALIERVHAKVGYVPIHVERVAEQPPPIVRIPHYRIYRPRGEG